MSTDLDQYTREDLADMIADEQKENTRLTSRLAEVEKERDELLKRREADRFECCVMSAVTGREDRYPF